MIRNGVGALAVVLAIAAGLLWTSTPLPDQPSSIAPIPGPEPLIPREWFTDNDITSSRARAEEPAKPLSEQVDQLLATRDPEHAFKAWHVISDCVVFAKDKDMAVDAKVSASGQFQFIGMAQDQKDQQARLCKGVTQRMLMSRFDYLATAARAGVFGSAYPFYEAGPFGDTSALTSRPDDPLVKAWKQEAVALLTAAARNGEAFALIHLMWKNKLGDKAIEKNPVLAQTYFLAWKKISDSPAYDAFFPPDPGLTAEQLALATEEANLIVAAYARRRKSSY